MSEYFKVKEDEEFQLPPYNVPGRILVEVTEIGEKTDSVTAPYKYELEVHYYEEDTSVFWINEGMDFDYWFSEYVNFTETGWYVLEDITGEYVRGEWGFTDDDEEWTVGSIRKATEDEVAAKTLFEEKPSNDKS